MVHVSMYFLMRGIGMEIYSIQFATVFFSTCILVAFNLLWGRFIDLYGFKATFSIAILVHILSPLCYGLAAYVGHGQIWIYLGLCFGSIAISGTNLSNISLVFAISKREDQTMTMAARAFLSGIVMTISYVYTQKILFPILQWEAIKRGYSEMFYLTVILGAAVVMRILVFVLWMKLPEIEGVPPTGTMIRAFYTTNPLRAIYSLGRFIWAKSDDTLGKGKYSEFHPSARWTSDNILSDEEEEKRKGPY